MSLSPAQLLSPLVDPKTGLITQGWGLWFQQLGKGAPGSSIAYIPSVTAASGTISGSPSIDYAQYCIFGKWCFIQIDIVLTVGTGATPQEFDISLPANAPSVNAAHSQSLAASVPALTTAGCIVFNGQISFITNTTNGQSLVMHLGGMYEIP